MRPLRSAPARLVRTTCPLACLALTALLLVACSPGGQAGPTPTTAVGASAASTPGQEPGTPQTDANWQTQWDATVAAANQEGSLTLGLNPGQPFRDWIAAFETAYPSIRVDVTQSSSNDFFQSILLERQSGQHNWDVILSGSDTLYDVLEPAGALDPLKPALLRPDVLDDSKWLGGFDAGFTDKQGAYVYDISATVYATVYQNTDAIPAGQITQIQDLTDPQWKGKLSLFDPRSPGGGAATLAHWIMVAGDTWVRQLLAQQPALSTDKAQQVDWLVHGEYPIALGPAQTVLDDLENKGAAQDIQPVAFDTDMGRRLSESVAVSLINQAPHPNAARVFLGWMLSQQGQAAYVKDVGENSRRLDVPSGPSDTQPDPTVTYFPSVNIEANQQYTLDAMSLAQAILQ